MRWGLTEPHIDGMLVGIRKSLGARSLVVALVSAAPLLAINGSAGAASKPAAIHVSPARVVNPSTVADRSYQPSKTRTLPSPASGGGLTRPLVSSPGTGAQLLQDPSFEFGVGNPYWPESSSGGFEVITPTNPHSGRYSVDLCGYPNNTPACLDVISQPLNFNVPSGIISAELSYWFWVGSAEPANTCTDYMTIGVFDSTNTADPANAATYCGAGWGDQQWHNQSINVTSYLQARSNQRLSVTIQGIDDANGKSSEFFTDDVALSIYTAPGAPTNVLAQPDNGEATISWEAPPDGGSPIRSYTITPFANGTTAGSPIVFNSTSTYEVMSGLLNGTAYTFQVAATNAYATGLASTSTNAVTPDRAYVNEVVSTNQFGLANSDGVTWQPMDATYLSTSLLPSSDSLAVLNANVDLWTANAGFNQDIGIAVSGGTGSGTTYPTVAGQPQAWKESGGYAGTFSPNAAAVHTIVALKAATTYTFTLVWKTNKPATGTSIFAGGGPIGAAYSPTRMTVQMVTASGTPLANAYVKTAASTNQFWLRGSNGSTWTDLGPGAAPAINFTAPDDGTVFVSGNADLWTTIAGFNQDLGITVQGGAYPTIAGQPELWKESGGYAGTYSPNAAAVNGMLAVSKGVTYTLKLQWKANRSGSGTILAGAGPIGSAYSPTRLSLWVVPTGGARMDAASNQQYSLTNNDGATWADMDATNLKLLITPSNNCVATLSANADLWTATAGINQDLGIQVSSTLGTYTADRVGWKESGGFAGTFSPNAASLQTLFPMNSGVTYAVKVQWKANRTASGASIFAGAGPIGSKYSPTRLTAQLSCPAALTDRITTAPQSVTAGAASGPIIVQLVDSYGNPAPAGLGGQTFAISSTSVSGQSVTLDNSGAPATMLTIPAGASSASFKFKDTVAETVSVQAQATGFTTQTQMESVVPDVTAQFKLVAPSSATHGAPFNLTITAQDKYGNTTPSYSGTVHFTSSDSAAVLPANYTFVSTDNGVRTFSITLNTAGTQTVTATDTPNSQITGVSGPISVS